jgi:hypothetical protein
MIVGDAVKDLTQEIEPPFHKQLLRNVSAGVGWGWGNERYVLFEMSRISSIIKSNDRASLRTRSILSRCDRLRSLSSVNSIIPMIHSLVS